VSLTKNITVQQKRPGVKTLILPGTPKANIEAVYDLSAFTQRSEEVERDSLGSTVTDSGKGRKFADDISWIWNNAYYHSLIGLDIHYQYTEVKIFLRNDHYKLIAPGAAENQPVSHHIYQEQLYYVFYAPQPKQRLWCWCSITHKQT